MPSWECRTRVCTARFPLSIGGEGCCHGLRPRTVCVWGVFPRSRGGWLGGYTAHGLYLRSIATTDGLASELSTAVSYRPRPNIPEGSALLILLKTDTVLLCCVFCLRAASFVLCSNTYANGKVRHYTNAACSKPQNFLFRCQPRGAYLHSASPHPRSSQIVMHRAMCILCTCLGVQDLAQHHLRLAYYQCPVSVIAPPAESVCLYK